MDRINHVKIVTPDPEAVERFLCEVLEIPEGWAFDGGGSPQRRESVSPAPVPRPVTWESVIEWRGDDGGDGRIVGSTESRQFQLLRGAKAHVWSVAVGTRHVERAWQRCRERGIPCSEMRLVPWTEQDAVRAFFAEVGGIVFEVMRVEPRSDGSQDAPA